MKVGLEQAAAERIDDLVRTVDRLTAAINENTAVRTGAILPPKPEPCSDRCACDYQRNRADR